MIQKIAGKAQKASSVRTFLANEYNDGPDESEKPSSNEGFSFSLGGKHIHWHED